MINIDGKVFKNNKNKKILEKKNWLEEVIIHLNKNFLIEFNDKDIELYLIRIWKKTGVLNFLKDIFYIFKHENLKVCLSKYLFFEDKKIIFAKNFLSFLSCKLIEKFRK